jgi:putative transposase
LFRDILRDARAKFSLSLYNYCLMTNHVHLLFAVPQEDTLSKAMHWVGYTFSRKFNKLSGRHGHLWENRFRSAIVEDECYFLRCLTYLDLNPVRAGIVTSPSDYAWCGHRALRVEDLAELDLHPCYLCLGDGPASRYKEYAHLLKVEAARPPVSLANEHFVGSARFVSRMLKKFGLSKCKALRHQQLGPGIISVGPAHGGRRFGQAEDSDSR